MSKFSPKRLATCAMLVALSVIVAMFCKTYLNFGAGLFRITFENIPIIFSGILFGPIWGGVVGATTDLVTYLLSPQIYPPNLIVTFGAFAIGVIAGIVSKYVVKKYSYKQIVYSELLAHIFGSMIIKSIGLYQFYGIAIMWRIPLYIVIAGVEIFVMCMLYKNKSFRNLVETL